MLPGTELMGCTDLAVPAQVMHHVVRVESAYNPYAIGVVGGRLQRQPRNLPEAVATARMLEQRGYNFSLGLAQVNRYNLKRYGLDSYEKAFEACPNLHAGSRILAECNSRAKGDWGDAFSCYYSGNFVTGYRHGYVSKVFASMYGGDAGVRQTTIGEPIDVVSRGADARITRASGPPSGSAIQSRTALVTQAQPAITSPARGPAPSVTTVASVLRDDAGMGFAQASAGRSAVMLSATGNPRAAPSPEGDAGHIPPQQTPALPDTSGVDSVAAKKDEAFVF